MQPYYSASGRRFARKPTGRPRRPLAERLWEQTDRSGGPDACWLFLGSTGDSLHGNFKYDGRNRGAHRVAWIASHPDEPIPPGMMVCHTCDVPPCVNPAHLFLGTGDDNMADMVAKGRQAYGVRNGRAKLSENDIIEIRRLYLEEGMVQWRIAQQFGIRQGHVSRILRRTNWVHLPS